jgi:transposase
MARRRFLVRDIAEILEHWQAGRSICAISRSLGVCRATVRKYVYAAEARGYHQGDPTPSQGWKAFLKEVIPRPPDPSTRSEVFAKLLPYQEDIRAALATTKASTVWQRLRDEKGVKVSLPSFYRYLSCFLTDVWKKPRITVRRDDPPPGDEGQIDYGYLGMWQDPKSGKRYRLWAFALILSFSRHMFVRVVTKMDQREWLICHILAFRFFGGAPKRITPDNLKTGVIKPDLYDPKFNQGYEEMAHHYGIIIDPARAGKPRDKARIERVIPYIRDSFWSGREFTSLEEINRQAVQWCRHRASQVGQSTRQTVESLLKEHALHYLRQCQGILRLGDTYGEERLEQACARASAFGDPSYRTVKTILERGLDKQPPLFEPVRLAGAFLRGPEELCSSIES